MSDERKERCENCRFWERGNRREMQHYEDGPPYQSDELPEDHPDLVSIGECKRYPPELVSFAIKKDVEISRMVGHTPVEWNSLSVLLRGSVWPVTWEFDWCGEWQARK